MCAYMFVLRSRVARCCIVNSHVRITLPRQGKTLADEGTEEVEMISDPPTQVHSPHQTKQARAYTHIRLYV